MICNSSGLYIWHSAADFGLWTLDFGLLDVFRIRPNRQHKEKRAEHILSLRNPSDGFHMQRVQTKESRDKETAPNTAGTQNQNAKHRHERVGQARMRQDGPMLLIVINDEQPQKQETGEQTARDFAGKHAALRALRTSYNRAVPRGRERGEGAARTDAISKTVRPRLPAVVGSE